MLEVKPFAGTFRVSSPYGWRVIGGVDDFHDGTDYAMPTGTPLFAMGNGVVEHAGDGAGGDGGGIAVAIVGDDDGDGQLFYLHMSRLSPDIRRGARVVAGQLIGYSGATGRVSGPHLHLQWRPSYPESRDTADVDPLVEGLPDPGDVGGDGSGAGALVAAIGVGLGLKALLSRRRR